MSLLKATRRFRDKIEWVRTEGYNEMVISSCKVQTDVKPNLYASLDIILEIGMNGSKPWSNDAQNGLLHHQISPKQSKMVRNGSKL